MRGGRRSMIVWLAVCFLLIAALPANAQTHRPEPPRKAPTAREFAALSQAFQSKPHEHSVFPAQRIAVAVQVNTDVAPREAGVAAYSQALSKVALDALVQQPQGRL